MIEQLWYGEDMGPYRRRPDGGGGEHGTASRDLSLEYPTPLMERGARSTPSPPMQRGTAASPDPSATQAEAVRTLAPSTEAEQIRFVLREESVQSRLAVRQLAAVTKQLKGVTDECAALRAHLTEKAREFIPARPVVPTSAAAADGAAVVAALQWDVNALREQNTLLMQRCASLMAGSAAFTLADAASLGKPLQPTPRRSPPPPSTAAAGQCVVALLRALEAVGPGPEQDAAATFCRGVVDGAAVVSRSASATGTVAYRMQRPLGDTVLTVLYHMRRPIVLSDGLQDAWSTEEVALGTMTPEDMDKL